jgi:dipeptidyl aminopeptidase/acylaminoacyl peptidase
LLEDYSAVAYVPPGYLLLLRGAAQNANVQTLLAQRFDAASRTLVGTPEPLADEINFETRLGLGYFSASAIGTLVYGNPEWRATRLTWFDRSGAVVGQVESTGDFSQPALSPNDATIVAQRVDPVSGVSDLWSIDAASGLGQRLTHGNFGSMPLWSPDGTQIVFSSARDRFPPNLFLATMSASGKEERLVESGDLHHPTDWSRDGRFVIYAAQRSGTTGWDLMKLPMTGPAEGRRPETIRDTAFDEHFGRLSPDGRWLAYASDESGTFEVYVRPFPRDGAPHRVSLNGGMEPLWRRDGSELFYVTPAGVLMTASVNAGASAFSRAGPMPLFPTQATPRIVRRARFLPTYRVSSDGRRFLLAVAAGEARTSPTKITFNWPSALTRP